MKWILGAMLCALAASSALAQAWVDGAGRSCDVACGGAGMGPVQSGVYMNGQPFYMCAANMMNEGFRGGYNQRPDRANSCTVGYGGREEAAQPYYCLCAPAAPPAQPGGVMLGPLMSTPQTVPANGGRRIRIEEATLGLNCGLPRGNATAHVTRWCDGARDSCDYTIDPGVLGGVDSCQEDFSVRYHCGDDGRAKLAQVTFSGVMGQVLLSCP